MRNHKLFVVFVGFFAFALGCNSSAPPDEGASGARQARVNLLPGEALTEAQTTTANLPTRSANTLVTDGGSTDAPGACLLNWQGTICGQWCTRETQWDRKNCKNYLLLAAGHLLSSAGQVLAINSRLAGSLFHRQVLAPGVP